MYSWWFVHIPHRDFLLRLFTFVLCQLAHKVLLAKEFYYRSADHFSEVYCRVWKTFKGIGKLVKVFCETLQFIIIVSGIETHGRRNFTEKCNTIYDTAIIVQLKGIETNCNALL